MVDKAKNRRANGQRHKIALLAISILGIAFSVSAQTVAEKDSRIAKNGLVDAPGSSYVVVHTDDQVGAAGLTAFKSCTRDNIAVTEEKAIDGARSVLLVMHFDSAGKIVGVHYGAKDICDFVQGTLGKVAVLDR
jgi:hypothetical protein